MDAKQKKYLEEYELYHTDYHGMQCNYPATPGWPPYERDNENGIVFMVVYMIVFKLRFGEIPSDLVQKFYKVVENLGEGLPMGLYNRGHLEHEKYTPEEMERYHMTISLDNLLFIAIGGAILGNPILANEIIRYGFKNFFRYDNMHPDKPRWSRILRPDIIGIIALMGSGFWIKLLGYLLSPYAIISRMLSVRNVTVKRPIWYTRWIAHIKYFFTRKKPLDDRGRDLRYPWHTNGGESGKQISWATFYALQCRNVFGFSWLFNFAMKRFSKQYDDGLYGMLFAYYAKWDVNNPTCKPILHVLSDSEPRTL